MNLDFRVARFLEVKEQILRRDLPIRPNLNGQINKTGRPEIYDKTAVVYIDGSRAVVVWILA